MSGAASLNQSQDPELHGATGMPERAQVGANPAVVANPAHEILAKLTLALEAERIADGSLEVALKGRDPRWSYHKSAVVLFVGCGLFWLCAFVALNAGI